MTQSQFTRVDMLLLAAALGLALMLLSPAVLRMREMARQRQCENNLRALGGALAAYHEAHGAFPPAAIASAGLKPNLGGVYANWAIIVLPQLGHLDLAASFDDRLPISHPSHAQIRMQELPEMTCPTDTYHRADNLYIDRQRDPQVCFARGNYAINGGPTWINPFPGVIQDPVTEGKLSRVVDGKLAEWGSGAAGFNKAFGRDEFVNGISTTVLLDEVRAGLDSGDPRGCWALGQVAASVTWAHGLVGDDCGPNCRNAQADDIFGGRSLHDRLGNIFIAAAGMQCCDHSGENKQATARSMHPGGVNSLFADGAARFIIDDVDGSLWHAIHSRLSRAALDLRELEIARPLCEADPDAEDPPSPSTAAEARGPAGGGPTGTAMPGGLGTPTATRAESMNNSLGMHLVRVPAGEFIMALPDDNKSFGARNPVPGRNFPAHRVRITKSYWLGVHEVTQGQYRQIMRENPSMSARRAKAAADIDDFPVENVSWEEAVAFCGRLSERAEERAAARHYRLPTEAEWEYACRAGRRLPFERPFESQELQPVGALPPNPFGLCDMQGNVFEWCQDWFALDYYARSPRDDPPGPVNGVARVVRGGPWLFSGKVCNYPRHATEPWRANPYIGFRVVCATP